MENHHVFIGGKKLTISIAVSIYQRLNIQIPMVFLWFSSGFSKMDPVGGHRAIPTIPAVLLYHFFWLNLGFLRSDAHRDVPGTR